MLKGQSQPLGLCKSCNLQDHLCVESNCAVYFDPSYLQNIVCRCSEYEVAKPEGPSLTLASMFSMITDYQVELGYDVLNMREADRDQYRKDCMLALYQEVAELVDSTPWKSWRAQGDQTLDIDNAEREIIDCIFFLFNIARTLGISGADLEDRFHVVLDNNLSRIENGYNTKN